MCKGGFLQVRYLHRLVLYRVSWLPADQQRKTGQGVLAQYTTVNADQVAIRPINVTPTQAAGVTLAALTAYQALVGVAKLEVDQTVFINGGSTAVGAFAIQLAKIKGAKVIATASAGNEAFVRKMGADEVLMILFAANSTWNLLTTYISSSSITRRSPWWPFSLIIPRRPSIVSFFML